MFVLDGNLPFAVKDRDDGYVTPAGPIQLLFTPKERQTALAIAADWSAKGWSPILYSKNDVDGTRTVLFNSRNSKRRLAA